MRIHTGLEAWVSIEGERCEEYGQTLAANGRDVTCWIASEAGKTFSVHWQDRPTQQMDYALIIDGVDIGGKCCVNPTGRLVSMDMTGTRISAIEEQPFMFAPIRQSDDESLLLNSVEGVGEIQIKTGTARFQPAIRTYAPPPSGKTFHERMKKGIDHQTSFGAAKLVAQESVTAYRPVPVGVPTMLTFKYRPLNVLQANGIAPRPKTIETKPVVKQPAIEDDDSEVEIVETKPKTSVKRERTDVAAQHGGSPARKKVKREAAPKIPSDDIIYISD
ncbi:hypothetical protein CYLTODRAFT_426462 [Cylindrobasidium torrendii FP15055 ss-10]|uniref:DUF7918 domain-containing protein n=1 Tax=Cylindrobasidium torrendii FP15055 ss-10 TaxID=1314674 RepID=A0A0D7AXB4_9AGAR|nr:hypothetical protein CYLTODRAFT_426462 [Cylindrobasidium torrendii FP15055 ss-10]